MSALLVKPARHVAMTPLERVVARRRHGLVGDCHAQPLGPRQVLIVREETLAGLGVEPWQVRANIATRGLDEQALRSGSVLSIGTTVRIRITHECEVCKVLRRYVDRETFRHLPGRRGSLGVLLRGGALALGDHVVASAPTYPEVPDAVYERVAWVIGRIPSGRVVTYDRLLTLVGVQRAFFRVLPTYLKRAAAAGLPAHRVLTSSGSLTGHLPGQREQLAAEGVVPGEPSDAWDKATLWAPELLYLSKQ